MGSAQLNSILSHTSCAAASVDVCVDLHCCVVVHYSANILPTAIPPMRHSTVCYCEGGASYLDVKPTSGHISRYQALGDAFLELRVA